jgi:hypothetical protein
VNFWFGGYCDNMEDLQDLHGVARGDAARGRCDLATRRILAHRLTEWIAKASLAPVDIEPHVGSLCAKKDIDEARARLKRELHGAGYRRVENGADVTYALTCVQIKYSTRLQCARNRMF